MGTRLKCEEEIKDNIVIIRLKKKIVDTSVADEFKRLLFGYLSQGKKRYIINFNCVELFDTGCLGVLISLYKEMKGEGRIVLCCVKDTVYQIFRLIHMDTLFKRFKSEEKAFLYLINSG